MMTGLSQTRRGALCVALLLAGAALLAAALGCRGWLPVWTALKVPALLPAFADMRIIQGAALSAAHGLDPQISNPFDPWQRPMDYPIVWAKIAAFLHVENEVNFFAFIGGMLAVLLGCLGAIVYRYPSVWILLAVFSTSTLLLVERGNSDITVFCLACLALWASSAWLGAFLIGIATVLKFFPLFSGAFLIRHKRAFATLALAAVIFVALSASELAKVKALVSLSPIVSYGAENLVEFARVNAAVALSPVLILLPHLLGAALILRYGRLELRPLAGPPDEKLFLAGAGVYIFSFILSCNWDYRLIFLILCIPYLTRLADRRLKGVALLSLIAAMNYLPLSAYAGMGGTGINLAAKSFLFMVLTALFCRALLRYDDVVRSLWQRLASGKRKAA